MGEEHGLTPTQSEVLGMLSRRPAGIRLGQLAELLQTTQPTTSDAVGALVRKKLVLRHSDPADGRATVLRLSANGQRLAERLPNSFEGVVAAMSAVDRELLSGIVMRTIINLVEKGVITPQRMCFSCRFFSPGAHPGSVKEHHCNLIDIPIGAGDLRIDCPEHQERPAA